MAMEDGINLDLTGMSEDDLLVLKDELDGEITAIRIQIEGAKVKAADGEYSDRTWWFKANAALKIKGRQSQQIQNTLGRLRREKNRELEKCFVDVARTQLSQAQFEEIMDEAKATQEAK